MQKRWLSLLLVAALLCSMTGCLQNKGLDQYTYVMGIGFDRGEKLPYRFTCMLQKIDYESSEQKLSGLDIVTAEGNNLFEAINTLSASLPLQLSFVRTVLIVVEKSLLTEDAFLEQLINTALSSLMIRYNADLFVSLCPAEEALRGLESDLDPGGVKIQENLETYSKDTGLIPLTNLRHIEEALLSHTHDIVAPLCGTASDDPGGMQDSVGGEPYAYLGGNLLIETNMKTELAGAALFSDGALVGLLNGQNTQLLQMAVGDFRRARVRFGNVNGMEISILLKRQRPTTIELTPSDPPQARFTITLTAYIEQPEHLGGVTVAQMEQWISEQLTERYDRLFAACRELQSDAFGLGTEAVKWFSDVESRNAFDYKALCASTEAVFDVRISLSNAPDKSVFE